MTNKRVFFDAGAALLAAVTAGILFGCQPVISDPVVAEAAVVLEKHHINAGRVNWVYLRSVALQSPMALDRRRAIQFLIDSLKEPHTRLVDRSETNLMARAESPNAQVVDAFASIKAEQRNGAAIITVPTFNFGSRDAATKFAQALHDKITEMSRHRPKIWVVDLRANQGGNMWAMFAGLSCLLQQDTFGAFVEASGKRTQWRVSHGQAQSVVDGIPADVVGVVGQCDADIVKQPRVVLTSSTTSSAAEGLVIGLMSSPAAKLYGVRTAGQSSGNSWFPLSDGSSLLVTSGQMVDPQGRSFPLGIDPSHFPSRGVWVTSGFDALELALSGAAKR